MKELRDSLDRKRYPVRPLSIDLQGSSEDTSTDNFANDLCTRHQLGKLREP